MVRQDDKDATSFLIYLLPNLKSVLLEIDSLQHKIQSKINSDIAEKSVNLFTVKPLLADTPLIRTMLLSNVVETFPMKIPI